MRVQVRARVGDRFVEIYMKIPLAVLALETGSRWLAVTAPISC